MIIQNQNTNINTNIMLANDFLSQKLRRILPVMGRIKIGEKRTTTTEDGRMVKYPRKLDHFLITKNFRDANGEFIIDYELMEKVAAVTGEEPNKLTKIPVVFLFKTPELNLQAWFVRLRGGKIWCKGDGKKARRLREDGSFVMVECPCEYYTQAFTISEREERCKLYGRLNCFIRDADIYGGVWVFNTTSTRSLSSIWAQLTMYSRQGLLPKKAFLLTINPEKVLVQDKQLTIYTVGLVYDRRYGSLKGTVFEEVYNEIELQEEKKLLNIYIPKIAKEEEIAIEEDLKDEFYPTQEAQEIANGVEEEEEKEKREEKEVKEKKEDKEGKDFEVKVVEFFDKKLEGVKRKKPITETQINVIMKHMKKHFEKLGIDPSEDPYIKELKNFTFYQAVEVIEALNKNKHHLAYAIIKKHANVIKESREQEGKSKNDEGLENLENLGDLNDLDDLDDIIF